LTGKRHRCSNRQQEEDHEDDEDKPSARTTTLLLTFGLALFGAGACGAAPT